MREEAKVIEVNDTTRITAYASEHYEGIAEVLQGRGDAGIQTIRNHQWLSPIATNDVQADTISRISYSYQWRYDQASKVEEVFTRYLSLSGIPFIQKTLRGYSPSEWHDVVIYGLEEHATVEHLEALFEDIDAIYKGDVFELRVERLITYTAENGNTLSRWEADEEFQDDYGCVEVTGYDSITTEANRIIAELFGDRVEA